MLRPHILILGAGFGGTYVAKKLAHFVKKGQIDVTIVNKTNYFLFTPLLHEVATGSLTPGSVAEPLREIFRKTGIEVCQGIVTSINTAERQVNITSNGDKHTIPYDYLVLATGAETNYYGISGAEKFTLPLKDLADAAHIRDQVIDSFEQAIMTDDAEERSRLLSFVIVGGGATGVEMAAELTDFLKGMVKRYYSGTNKCKPEDSKVSVIHAGAELLQQFAPSLRQIAAKRLQDDGVVLHLGSTVTSVSAQGLALSNNTTVPAATVIWAAGVKATIPQFEGDFAPTVVGGRLVVDKSFRIVGDERVFALGDIAGYIDVNAPKSALVPMLAQVAVGQSKAVARNVVASFKGKKLMSYEWQSKGSMVSMGQWFAIGEIFSMKLAGKMAWWVWRTVYLSKFASWKKRIRIAFEWTLGALYPRDITKLG